MPYSSAGLPVVARGDTNHAFFALLVVEGQNTVGSAAHFKCTAYLQHLRLQIHLAITQKFIHRGFT